MLFAAEVSKPRDAVPGWAMGSGSPRLGGYGCQPAWSTPPLADPGCRVCAALGADGPPPGSRQCLLAGTFLEVEEADGAQLRPQARNLLCSLELVRTVLREQSLSQPSSYPEPVQAVLIQFDRLFAEFELRWGPVLGCWGGGGLRRGQRSLTVPRGSPAMCPRWWR